MTDRERNYIINAMARPCKATLELLLERVELMVKVGYTEGYDLGYGAGQENWDE